MMRTLATTKFINPKKYNQMVLMPQSAHKRASKIPFEFLRAEEKVSRRCGPLLLKSRGVYTTTSGIPSLGDANRAKHPKDLPRKVLCSKFGRTRIVGGVPPKSIKDVSSGKLPLKSRDVVASKLPTRAASLLNKKVSSSRIVMDTLMQKEHVNPRFLSLLMGKRKFTRYKAATPRLGRRLWRNDAEASRLSHAQRLRLFQALLREPLPFLELHGRFGVSKQTIRGLVKNRLLRETWGPKAIGVRLALTSKGKTHLKGLEAAARIEPATKEGVFIRLKHRASI